MTEVEKIRDAAEIDDNNVAATLMLLMRLKPKTGAFRLLIEVVTRTIVEVDKINQRIDDLELSGSDSEELEARLTCDTCGVIHKAECKGPCR